MNFKDAKTFEGTIAVGVALVALFLTWRRLYIGVDFTDEAFYIALQYRFALGDIPIRDEQNLAQFASLLVMPFTRIFLHFFGTTDGIFLFTRHLHLAFTILVGLSVYLSTHQFLRWPIGLTVSTICVVFVPFNIHGLSYNTMGCGFFTMGCFLGMTPQRQVLGMHWIHMLSGICHGLTVLVYPTLAIPIFACFTIILMDNHYPRMNWINYVAGGLLASMVPLLLVLNAGVDSLSPMAEFFNAAGAQVDGQRKLLDVFIVFWQQLPHLKTILTGMAIVGIWYCFKPKWIRYFLPFLPLLLIPFTSRANFAPTTYLEAHYLVIAVSLFGPFAYGFSRSDIFSKNIFKLVWVPSFIGGIVTAWSSGNGTVNAAIGIFPAALASILLIIRALQLMPLFANDYYLASDFHLTKRVLILACPILIILPLLIGGQTYVYGENRPFTSTLVDRITWGPYAGIKTSAEKKVFLKQASKDILSQVRPSDTVLFYSDFPAGYLIANNRPATNSVWLSTLGPKPTGLESTLKYYNKTGTKPDVIFMTKKSAKFRGLLDDIVNGNEYQKVFEGDFCNIYRRQKELIGLV